MLQPAEDATMIAAMIGPLRRVLNFLGLARLSWNSEYSSGRWSHIVSKSPTTIELVQRYARGGRIVEIGCGEGTLAACIDANSYSGYLGVDISDVAISRAAAKNMPKCEFAVADIRDWSPPAADVVVMEEVLYYLEPSQQERLLSRSLGAVAPSGAVVIVVFDFEEHAATLDRARSAGRLLEERRMQRREYLVIGPSADASSGAAGR
jgi:trans-aconitate methyltransferase